MILSIVPNLRLSFAVRRRFFAIFSTSSFGGLPVFNFASIAAAPSGLITE